MSKLEMSKFEHLLLWNPMVLHDSGHFYLLGNVLSCLFKHEWLPKQIFMQLHFTLQEEISILI